MPPCVKTVPLVLPVETGMTWMEKSGERPTDGRPRRFARWTAWTWVWTTRTTKEAMLERATTVTTSSSRSARGWRKRRSRLRTTRLERRRGAFVLQRPTFSHVLLTLLVLHQVCRRGRSQRTPIAHACHPQEQGSHPLAVQGRPKPPCQEAHAVRQSQEAGRVHAGRLQGRSERPYWKLRWRTDGNLAGCQESQVLDSFVLPLPFSSLFVSHRHPFAHLHVPFRSFLPVSRLQDLVHDR